MTALAASVAAGTEWVVEATGCDPARLRSVDVLRELFDRVVRDLDLHPVADAQWHEFDGPGGVTGLLMLSESHLAVHTFPEHGSACLNLFCCRPREGWDWNVGLRESLGAEAVAVRELTRSFAASDAPRSGAEDAARSAAENAARSAAESARRSRAESSH